MAAARKFAHEPDERADLFAQNAVLDLLVAQVRQAVDANPDILNPLCARLARLSPLEPSPACSIDRAVAPAPSREATPKPLTTTEPEAQPAPAALPGDLDRLVSLANLDGFLRQYVRSLKAGAYRDAVNAHAEFVKRELAAVKARLEIGNGGNCGAA